MGTTRGGPEPTPRPPISRPVSGGTSVDVNQYYITMMTPAAIEPTSFFGRLRRLYSDVVLKTQLEQLRKQGTYNAFKLGWHPVYDVRRLYGAKTRASITTSSR